MCHPLEKIYLAQFIKVVCTRKKKLYINGRVGCMIVSHIKYSEARIPTNKI